MPRNGKAVALILGKLAKEPRESAADEEEEASEEMDMGLQSAAEEAMAAIRDGDAAAFASALKSFVQQCGMHEYEEE